MKIQKVFKLETTILIVEANTEGCGGRQYVSVTANEIEPKKTSEIIEEQKEYLEEGESGRMAVEAKQTTDGLTTWIDQFGENDLLDLADISLYPSTVEINGNDYNFLSQSCGCMHDTIKGATDIFNELIDMHLSENIKGAERLMSFIKPDDVDAMVLKFTKKIIK